MGRYIVWEDVVNRYPDAAKLGGAETVNSSWICGAEAELDARLSARYTTPLTTSPAPDLVRDLCVDLTYYKANIRSKGVKALGEYIDSRFTMLINGTMALPVDVTVTTVSEAGGSYASAFGRDDPIHWRPSADGVAASKDERDSSSLTGYCE